MNAAVFLRAGALALCGLAVAGCPTDDGGDEPLAEGEVATEPTVLHRLTEDQLNHSIQDLFLDASVPRVQLPPEIPVNGFENNAVVRGASPYLVESIQRDLQAVTAHVMDAPQGWLQCTPDGGADPMGCGHATLFTLIRRAFRRPVTSEEDDWITGRFDQWLSALGFRPAMELAVQTLLQSPDFLYLVERPDPEHATGSTAIDDFELASRMAYFLWDSMPDAALFAAAANGELQTEAGVRAQAERMVASPRADYMLLRFFEQWLAADLIEDVQIDPETYFADLVDNGDDEAAGGLIAEFRLALEAEFELFITHSVLADGAFSSLLTSRQTWASEQTAEYYNATIDDSQPLVIGRFVGNVDYYEITMYPATLPQDQRAGFLTSLPFLAGHAHPVFPSPVLRGVFVRERMLCLPPGSPPDDVPPIEEIEGQAPKTNRDRYAAHTQNPACSVCHEAIDGAGFPFENYDSLGAWRDQDNGYPVDSSGALVGTDVDGPVADGVELAQRLATSRTAHDCMVRQVWRYAMHRSEGLDDDAAIVELQDQFWASGGQLRPLLVDMVASPAFRTRLEPQP